jgi:hypothetical protein
VIANLSEVLSLADGSPPGLHSTSHSMVCESLCSQQTLIFAVSSYQKNDKHRYFAKVLNENRIISKHI